MLADPLLQKFGVIIVDEAHERNILTDIVLGLLKKIIKVMQSSRKYKQSQRFTFSSHF